MDLISLVASIFESRGYTVVNSSSDNSYLLLEKDGERTAVGYSTLEPPATDEEAHMFISMAENDSVADMLFIHPGEMGCDLREVLTEGNVVIWDRTALAIALGESRLKEEGWVVRKPEERDSISTPSLENEIIRWFSGEDVDPLKELRDYESRLRESGEEVGGFKVNKVDIGREGGRGVLKRPGEAPRTDDDPKRPTVGQENAEPMEIDKELDGPEEAVTESTLPSDDPIPLPGLFSVEDEDPDAGSQPNQEEDVWASAPLIRPRMNRGEAQVLMENSDGEYSIEEEIYPHRLYRVSYSLFSDESDREVEAEGIFLVDLVSGEVSDVPRNVAASLETVRPGISEGISGGRVDPELDEGEVLRRIATRIGDEPYHEERKVHDGPSSTIWRRMRFKLRDGSLRIDGSTPLLIGCWTAFDEGGKRRWSIDGFSGRRVPRED